MTTCANTANTGSATTGKNLKKLTLLHSNDLHGDFLAEEIDEKLVGGVSYLSGYLDKVRTEEKNVIYAIAGDMFRGSVIDSEFKGMSTIEIMNLLGPDVATIGNHEIDYGVAHLLFLEKCSTFPIVNANLHISTNGRRLFMPETIIEIDGMKILFIGIITEEVLAAAKSDTMVGTFLDIEEAAVDVGRICNAYNATDIDLTVLLTHIGFEEDQRLAAKLDPLWGVDVIIGGHSHTFMDEPCIINGIPIVQAGTGTDQIGRFDIMIDTDNNCIDTFTWQSIPICSETCPRDEVLEELILSYKDRTDQKYGRVITRFKCRLTHPSRTQETALGNLVADAFRESLGVDIVFAGSGSIRNEQAGPIVTFGNLNELFPYDDAIYQISVTGAQVRRMLQHMLRDEAWAGHTEFYQLSKGMRVTYNRTTREIEKLNFKGKPIDDQAIYTVGVQAYHYTNLKDFLDVTPEECEANAPTRTLCTSARDVLEEFLISHSNLKRSVEGRLVLKD